MIIFRYSLFCLLLHQMRAGADPAEEPRHDDEDTGTKVARIIRDITGQYHPELHGEHAQKHGHGHATIHTVTSVSNSQNDGTGPVGSGSVQVVEFKSGLEDVLGDQNAVLDSTKFIPPGYYLPPPPPVYTPPEPVPDPHTMQPNGYANCGCVQKGRCAKEVLDYQPILLSKLKNDVRCGYQFDLCCPEDPWPGPIDQFKPIMPCYPVEECEISYGQSPYDIQKFGALGPCLGLGSVRCIKPRPPPTIIIPIIPPVYNPPPPVVYEPPPTIPTTTTTTTTTPPPTLPPVTPTPTPPVVIYEPPPTTVYEPPSPPVVVYEPPVPVVPPTPTYEPPTETYVPPAPVYEPPVETYVPPAPVYEPPQETYVPPAPTPVDTYEPPQATYEPPVPVDTYEPPQETYEPPETDYGVPAPDVPRRPYRRPYAYGSYPGYYNRYHSRYGSPWSTYGRGYYPGYGFRKHISFSKGFYG